MTAEHPPAAPPPADPPATAPRPGTGTGPDAGTGTEPSTGPGGTEPSTGTGPGGTGPDAGEPSESPTPAAGRHLLVLPDRDAAEELAEELAELLGLAEPPVPLREALAGEDDAEDAQWLLVLEDPDGRHDPRRLAGLAEDYEGWLERE